MRTHLAGFGAGVVFAVGLAVSGMTRPEKVIGFLDPVAWDPTLLFVMGGAVGTYLAGWLLLVRRRTRPLAAPRFALPTRRDVDARLVAGAAVFGVGWGLGGYCPGPALVGLSALQGHTLGVVAGMVAGILAYHLAGALRARTPAPAARAELRDG